MCLYKTLCSTRAVNRALGPKSHYHGRMNRRSFLASAPAALALAQTSTGKKLPIRKAMVYGNLPEKGPDGHTLSPRERFQMAKDAGFWCGLTIYPVTKVTPQRGVDILEQFGTDMICVNSASDWGESGPNMLVDTTIEFRRRGHSEDEAIKVFHDNPCRFFGQSGKWKVKPIGK